MDEIDKKIIEILKKDGGTPLSQVADMIGIPRPTVYLRFNKMKETGIIKGFNIILGNTNEGMIKSAIITIKDYLISGMGERSMKTIGSKLAKRQDVVFAAKLSKDSLVVIWRGDFDPHEFSEVISVKEIETEIFKSP